MDVCEKEVLKKKDFLLHTYMQWNDTLKAELEKEHIIGLDQVNMIERRQDAAAKSRILLDRLKFKGREGDLVKLAEILEDTCLSFHPEWHNRWLAEEIREELKDQKCELNVSEGITHEAGTIVHRQFGHGKRLSESEKKALVLILCVETQKTLNIWKREIDRTEDDIKYQQELNDFKDDTVNKLVQFLNDYITQNKSKLPVRSKDFGTSLSTHLNGPMRADIYKPSPLDNLKGGVKSLMEMIGASLLSAENLDNERGRVLEMVDATERNKTERVLLDQEIAEAIERRRQELASTEFNITQKEQMFSDLLKELREAKEEADRLNKNKEKNVGILMNEVHRAKEKAIEYNMEAIELRKKLKLAKAELHDWAERFEIIERGGRLNQIYKRDERILAKKKKSQPGDTNEEADQDEALVSEAKDHFKEFEEFEKKFLSNKMPALQKKNSQGNKSRSATPTVKKSSKLPAIETGAQAGGVVVPGGAVGAQGMVPSPVSEEIAAMEEKIKPANHKSKGRKGASKVSYM